ncbi:MAG: nitrite/sulfite reductase, partial [Pseudomonadota bacterium]
MIVGGGLGRTPRIGETIKPFLPKDRLLSYLEAILRVYNRHGRRDNLYKARIKILVEALGVEAFRKEVEDEWALIAAPAIDLPEDERARIAAYFEPPKFEMLSEEALADDEAALARARSADAAFDRWARVNVKPHRVTGYAASTTDG